MPETKHTPQEGESEADFMERCVAEHEGDPAEARSSCQGDWDSSRNKPDPTNPQLEENRRKLGL